MSTNLFGFLILVSMLWISRLALIEVSRGTLTPTLAANGSHDLAKYYFASKQTTTQNDGMGLIARLNAAVQAGREQSSKDGIWIAYAFDRRSDFSIDTNAINASDSATMFYPSVFVEDENQSNPSLGVVLRYNPSGDTVLRVELKDFGIEPFQVGSKRVGYWLGKATGAESLGLLTKIIESTREKKVALPAIAAVAMHHNKEADPILVNLVNNISGAIFTRSAAAFWLGLAQGRETLLIAFARGEQESPEVRKASILGLGLKRTSQSLSILRELYFTLNDPQLKENILIASSITKAKPELADLLIKVFQTEVRTELRRRTLYWLSQIEDRRGLELLAQTVNNASIELDVQLQAVASIGMSKQLKPQAILLLEEIAKSHPNFKVRQVAEYWLKELARS
jgi:hypothetical protein